MTKKKQTGPFFVRFRYIYLFDCHYRTLFCLNDESFHIRTAAPQCLANFDVTKKLLSFLYKANKKEHRQ